VTVIVLVVDDEDPIRELVRGLLMDEGYQVLDAPNGAVALELARQHQPGLVLTDLMMPVMDGTTLCGKLRSDPQTTSVPVIVMTASGPTAAAASGADAYLIKPFDLDLLLELVARYTSGSPNGSY
jgi:CheY-like chemotaxis protein